MEVVNSMLASIALTHAASLVYIHFATSLDEMQISFCLP